MISYHFSHFFRSCQTGHSSFRTLKNHRDVCSRLNANHQLLVIGEKENDEVTNEVIEPRFKYCETKGREFEDYLCAVDLECEFCDDSDLNRDIDQLSQLNNSSQILNAKMGVVATASLMEPGKYDTEETLELKRAKFPTMTRTGDLAPLQCLRDVISHAKLAHERRKRIHDFYAKVRMSPEDNARFAATRNCDICGVFFQKEGPFKATRDHSHVGAMEENGRGGGGGLRNKLCSQCNGKKKKASNFTAILHFGSNFDFLFLIKQSFEAHERGEPIFRRLRVIPKGTPVKFLTFEFEPFCLTHDDPAQFATARDVIRQSFNWRSGNGTEEDASSNDSESEPPTQERPQRGRSEARRERRKRPKCDCYPATITVRDSYSYSSSSLANLVEAKADEFRRGQKTFPELFPIFYQYLMDEKFLPNYLSVDLLLAKGTVPFLNFRTSDPTFLARQNFIPQNQWVIDMRGNLVSNEDYERAIEMWNALAHYYREEKAQPMTMQLFFEFYCMTDVYFCLSCHLSMAKEHFKHFQRNMFQFPSLPSFSLACFLSTCSREKPLRCLTDPNHIDFYEGGIIGGPSFIGSVRFGKSNLQSSPNFQPHLQEELYTVLDVNSMYSACMLAYMQISHFSTLSALELRELEYAIQTNEIWRYWTDEGVKQITDPITKEKVWISTVFQVDLEIPHHLQELVKSFPIFFIRHPAISSWQSPKQKQLSSESRKASGLKPAADADAEMARDDDFYASDQRMSGSWKPVTSADRAKARIIPSIAPLMEKYKTCHRTLKFLLGLGIKLKKIHYAINARSFPIARSYIQNNCARRSEAVSKCESARLKLANNSLYGTARASVLAYSLTHSVNYSLIRSLVYSHTHSQEK